MGRSGSRIGCPNYFCTLLTRERRGDLICIGVSLALYAVNQQIKYQVEVPLVGDLLRCHFNDYLGGLAFAAYLNLILSFSRWPEKRLKKPVGFVAVGALCGLFWEGVAPLVLPNSTGDPLDVIAYILGMLTYWWLWGRRFPSDAQAQGL